MRILIVEDELSLAKGLQFNFEQEGYDVTLADDGIVAVEQFKSASPRYNLVMLDLMLPGQSGYETCRQIRELDGRVPILVLSARTLAEDKAMAFDCGTDQYVTKPFALPELLSRVRNLIERHPLATPDVVGTESSTRSEPDTYQFGDVFVDFRRFEIEVRGKTISLTTKEQQLLRFFIDHESEVVSRSQIQESVWEDNSDLTTRSIDNFVLRLRRYIEVNPGEPRHFLSIRGTGYRFLANPDAAVSVD